MGLGGHVDEFPDLRGGFEWPTAVMTTTHALGFDIWALGLLRLLYGVYSSGFTGNFVGYYGDRWQALLLLPRCDLPFLYSY